MVAHDDSRDRRPTARRNSLASPVSAGHTGRVTVRPAAGGAEVDRAIARPGGRLSEGDLSLRPISTGDVEGLVEAISGDESISRWTRIPWPYTHRHAAEFVATSGRGWANGTDAPCLIVHAESDRVVGGIGLHRIGAPPVARSSFLPDEVGYWLALDARGQGLATRALLLFSRWALRDLGRPFLNLQTRAGNDASQRVARRVGYRFVEKVPATEVDDDTHDHNRFVLTIGDIAQVEVRR